MSEISKLKVKARAASTKKLSKMSMATKDAVALVAEIQELDDQRAHAIQKEKDLRVQLKKVTNRLLQAENESQKILNITGGKFK